MSLRHWEWHFRERSCYPPASAHRKPFDWGQFWFWFAVIVVVALCLQ